MKHLLLTFSLLMGAVAMYAQSEPIERYNLVVCYIDESTSADCRLYYSDPDNTSFTLSPGYNLMLFNDEKDTPIKLVATGVEQSYCYVWNDEPWQPEVGTANNYVFNSVGNGEICKLYFQQPAWYDVNFVVTGNSTKVDAYKDISVPIPLESKRVLTGTQIGLFINSDEVTFTCRVNGKMVAEQTDQASFTVTENARVELTIYENGQVTTSVDEITTDSQAPKQYFNVLGMPVTNPQPGNIYIVRQGTKATKQRF